VTTGVVRCVGGPCEPITTPLRIEARRLVPALDHL